MTTQTASIGELTQAKIELEKSGQQDTHKYQQIVKELRKRVKSCVRRQKGSYWRG